MSEDHQEGDLGSTRTETWTSDLLDPLIASEGPVEGSIYHSCFCFCLGISGVFNGLFLVQAWFHSKVSGKFRYSLCSHVRSITHSTTHVTETCCIINEATLRHHYHSKTIQEGSLLVLYSLSFDNVSWYRSPTIVASHRVISLPSSVFLLLSMWLWRSGDRVYVLRS